MRTASFFFLEKCLSVCLLLRHRLGRFALCLARALFIVQHLFEILNELIVAEVGLVGLRVFLYISFAELGLSRKSSLVRPEGGR